MGNDKVAQARLRDQTVYTKSPLREFTQLNSQTNNSNHRKSQMCEINYLWLPTVKPSNMEPVFEPAYFDELEERCKAINAIIEVRALWKYVIEEAHYNYSNMYSQLSIPLRESVKIKCQKHKESFAVYDTKTQSWLIEPSEPKYNYCYNGEFFKDFQCRRKITNEYRLLLVGKYTILRQEVKLLEATDCAQHLETFVMPRNNLTSGVPGCGKTTYIIKNHSHGSLVLTSCTEGAQDVRKRMAEISGIRLNYYRESYRTIDSYLLNSRRRYSHVWMDEALMEHPGKLFLVCLFSRCTEMFMLGDPNQLQYINRVDAVKLRYAESTIFFKPTKTLNISYRCPVDVMAAISSKYDQKVYSASNTMRSMNCETLTSLKDVPNVAGTKYLVFKQTEKNQMHKEGFEDVSTIHEFQGKQAKNLILVRTSCNLREALYKSDAHILVGITRHEESFVYYTPVADDVEKIIKKTHHNLQLSEHKIAMSPEITDDKKSSASSISSRPVTSKGSVTQQRSSVVTPSSSKPITNSVAYNRTLYPERHCSVVYNTSSRIQILNPVIVDSTYTNTIQTSLAFDRAMSIRQPTSIYEVPKNSNSYNRIESIKKVTNVPNPSYNKNNRGEAFREAVYSLLLYTRNYVLKECFNAFMLNLRPAGQVPPVPVGILALARLKLQIYASNFKFP